jgi:hypothetical protein
MMVRFKTLPDPKSPEGFLLTFETVGDLVRDVNPLTVAFNTKFDLESAFLAAGIYLRDLSYPDPERSPLPDPEQDYEVNSDVLRKIGFDIPSDQPPNDRLLP